MCDTNLKFGPEWLRALTEPQIKNCEEKFMYTPALANMKLAEFRYGKEEMLALFSPELDPPKELLSLGALYVDSCQFPLNLTQMGAEEARAWQQKTPEIMGSTTNNRTFTTGPPVVAGGRAQSMLPSSRGRGRGRTASFPYFDRNRFDEPDSDNSNGVQQQQQQTINGGKLNKGEKGGWSDSKGRPIEAGFSDGMRDWRDRKGGPVNENTKVWGGAGAPVKQGPVNGHSNSNMNWRSQERNGNTGEPNSFSKPRANDWSGANNTAAFKQQRDKGGNFQQNHHLPEWATNSGSGADGGFDDNGKFRPDEFTRVDNVPKWTDDEKWIEEEVEPEIINQQQPNSVKPMSTKPQSKQPSPKENISPTKNIPNPTILNSNQNNVSKLEDLSSAVSSSQVAAEPPSNVHSSMTGGMVPTPSSNISSLPSIPTSHPNNINNEPSFENLKWSYLDPQGQIQGPFQPEEMLEWSTAGYFPNDLLIKRNIDGRFIPLSEMSRVYGRNPFTAGPSPRGISNVETNEHINQQQYLHHLLMQQQQQQLLAQQQLLMLHHQNSNLNSMLLNKAINPALMKPGGEALLPNVGKQAEEMLSLPMRNQNFDLSPEISTSVAPSFDPIKSLLNQLKESTNSFLPTADEKESSISPQHIQQQQHQHQIAAQIQQHQTPLGHQQSHIQPAQVQISQEHHRSAMQFNQHQQAPTMAMDQQLQAQLAAIGVEMSQPASGQVDVTSRLQETARQESLEINQPHMIATEKRQPISKQKGTSPVKSFKQATPTPSDLKLELKVEEVMVVKEEVEIRGGISKEPVIVSTPGQPLDADTIIEDFQVPKNNEKKEKKSRKSEIKKKAKKADAKVAAPYIPGLPGSQQPAAEPTTPDEDRESQERQDGTEKPHISNEQGTADAMEAINEVQAKPAPWANCLSPENRELSIQDIQRIEAEKEVKRRAERQQVLEVEQRERRKIEQEQRKLEKQATWSTKTVNNNVKSLAEIQAEEEKNMRKHEQKQFKDQQTAAVKTRKASQRAPEKPTSWAGKIAANIPAPQPSPQIPHSKTKVVVPTDGFWEHGGPSLAASASTATASNSTAAKPNNTAATSNNTASQKNKDKKQASSAKADNKADLTMNFKSWCRTSLESLNTEVDIETFMGFLQDIESPYEVNDYIKSYVGEGKAHKKFGSDYLERRSQLKNALKKNMSQAALDDLTSPAAALAPDLEFQEAPRKGKKKTRNSKTNLNHLLGFTTAPGHGLNRGELDMPM